MLKQLMLEGGSKFGVGYWSKVLGGCAREAELEKSTPPRRNTGALLTGSIAHTMLGEWFRTGGNPLPYSIRDEEGPVADTKEYKDAERVYNAYLTNFPDPFRWGAVYEVEKEIFLLPNLTVKPDLLGPDWQVDHKFVKEITPEVVNHYLDSLNVVVYLQNPGTERIVFNFVSKQKESQFLTIERLRRADDDQRYKAFLGAIEKAQIGTVNPTACHRWIYGRPTPCQFLGRGCQGY